MFYSIKDILRKWVTKPDPEDSTPNFMTVYETKTLTRINCDRCGGTGLRSMQFDPTDRKFVHDNSGCHTITIQCHNPNENNACNECEGSGKMVRVETKVHLPDSYNSDANLSLAEVRECGYNMDNLPTLTDERQTRYMLDEGSDLRSKYKSLQDKAYHHYIKELREIEAIEKLQQETK